MSYQLVIAEKPSVARSIAGVIGADKKQDGYMEGNGYLVSWCIGHLVSLADAGTYDERFKKWRYDDLPILPQEWQYIIPDDKKKQFDTLRSLMERPDVTGLVCATDAGREGELIFRFVYQMAGCKKPFQRLWISSMEDAAIQDGFAHLKPGADYDNLYQSALCRAQADWLVGINATRLFSILYHKTLTVGRVQTGLNGRKLTTLQYGNDSISYKYDSNGVRTSKTVNGVEYTYEYLNGKLMHETRGEKVFDYCYDTNGQLYAVSYKANSSTDAVTYYYAHNWRGDITSIYDAGGNVVAKYEYDDWGNVLTVTDANNKSITDKNHIANLNPFRYRSYYYDSESGFYYLMSRYYDPVVHRFINADGYFQSGDSILDTNMNAYCRNNPIMNLDFTGMVVFSVSLSLNLGCVFGYGDGMALVFDGDGNVALQKTFCYTDFTNPSYLNVVAGASIGVGGSFSCIWDAENIQDLEENQTTQLGGTFGPSWYAGLDAVWVDNHTMPLSGVSLSGGVGVGAELHVQRPRSFNIISYNFNDNDFKFGSNNVSNTSCKPQKTNVKVRCCRACGRPDYICPSPIYY